MYPNTNHMSALLGRPIQPNYRSRIDAQVQALPAYLQLQEQRKYNDAQQSLQERGLNLQRKSLDENIRQNNMNFALAEDQAEAAKKNAMYGNLISGAGLGLNAYQALDEAGVDFSRVGSALKGILPTLSDTASQVTEFAKPGDMMAVGNMVASPSQSIWQNAPDWSKPVTEAVSGAGEWLTDIGQGAANFVTKDIPELYDVGKKVFSGDGGWSDVQGWVEGLFQ